MTALPQNWSEPIRGTAIAASIRQRLEPFRSEFAQRQTRIAIVRFESPEQGSPIELARYSAALTSMNQKLRSFDFLGCQLEPHLLRQDTTPAAFAALIDRLNQNPQVRGLIVQYPVPPAIEPLIRLIAPEKDLDALTPNSPFSISATSEGIVRLVEPFAVDALVAVVGANGFVGRGVVQQLRDRNIAVLALDQRDPGFRPEDLLRVREADVVVSVTGQPEVLDERHVTPFHRLVVDSGYVPLGNRTYGDVRQSATSIPQNFTPVPGGVGPVEMAVLMERLVQKEIAPNLESWRLESMMSIAYLTRLQVQRQQEQWAQAIYPTAIAAFVQQAQGQTELSEVTAYQEQHYRLILDRNASTFSIEGNNERGMLAAYTFNPNRIVSAAGLTRNDFLDWQEIQQQTQLNQSRSDERER